MNDQKIAEELTRLAKELTAGIREFDPGWHPTTDRSTFRALYSFKQDMTGVDMRRLRKTIKTDIMTNVKNGVRRGLSEPSEMSGYGPVNGSNGKVYFGLEMQMESPESAEQWKRFGEMVWEVRHSRFDRFR